MSAKTKVHAVKAEWCITEDHLENVERIAEKTPDMIVSIRLFDDDDVLYYSGWATPELMNSANPFEPLDWATWNAGCTKMKYKEEGKDWQYL